MELLPSPDVRMTSENPSGLGFESIWMSMEESRSHSAEVCGKVRGGSNDAGIENPPHSTNRRTAQKTVQ